MSDLYTFAADSAKLVGIGGLLTANFRKTRHSGRITSLYVHASHRRSGIARSLRERVLLHAAEGGLRSVRLEVVAGNRKAIALYERHGFTSYGREPARLYCAP